MLIEEYFQIIGNHITDCPYVAESQIRNDKRSFYIGVVEGEIRFTDNSFLHFIEFINVKEGINRYKYSYHYQDEAEKVVFRYDMAPHHKEIKTFPHHKHLGSENVTESLAPSLAEVLQEIEGILILPKNSN
ncbi:MAG: DUF6516 family protein [Desulfobacterales bacterium]